MSPYSSQTETLKIIAELLNESTDRSVLGKVLHAFISITHFEVGWIFLEQNGTVVLTTDTGLPPALKQNNKELMCGEDCYCVNRFKKRALTQATSIIACKRIDEAFRQGKGNTDGITHHATVPLQTPNRLFGLFNVAASGRTKYTEDLELLESVALQMGTALERIERFEQEECRNALLIKSHAFTKEIQQARNIRGLGEIIDSGLDEIFEPKEIRWRRTEEKQDSGMAGWIDDLYFIQLIRDQPFSKQEQDTFTLIREYIDVSWKQLLLREKEKDIARREERSLIAQDLHDSVNQLLFSIVLTSKGAEGEATDHSSLKEQIQYIQKLSSQALNEMRVLIANHKGERLKEGVFVELNKYAKTIGLDLQGQSEGTSSLPLLIEESLLRMGQEALHNVKKHAGVNEARLWLEKGAQEIKLTIQDDGKGFSQEEMNITHTYGLNGMKERAACLRGEVQILSQKGKGTTVHIVIPLEAGKYGD